MLLQMLKNRYRTGGEQLSPTALRELLPAISEQLQMDLEPTALLEGLRTAFQRSKRLHRLYGQHLARWHRQVKDGTDLAEILGAQVPAYQRSALLAGGKAGCLQVALDGLLRTEEAVTSMRKNLSGSLRGPAARLGIAWVMLAFMNAVVVPQIIAFSPGGIDNAGFLSELFVLLAQLSMSPAFLLGLVVLAGVAASIPFLLRTNRLPASFARIAAEVPPGLFEMMRMRVSILLSLSLLLQVGMPPSQALEELARSLPAWWRLKLSDAATQARDGAPLWKSLEGVLEPEEQSWLEIHLRSQAPGAALARVSAAYQNRVIKRGAGIAKWLSMIGYAVMALVFLATAGGLLGFLSMGTQML